MATATGTATDSTDLLVKLNTFLTSNGWTKLRGETDLSAGSSIVSARYWRLYVTETDGTNDDFRELELLEWRATTGGANLATTGANYSFSSLASGSGSDLVSGSGTVQSADIDDTNWWVQYDFGSATPIHEIVMKCDTDNYAPSIFSLQWSHDAKTWCTMESWDLGTGTWTADNQTQTLTIGASFTNSKHTSSTACRRGGWDGWNSNGGIDRYRQADNNIWSWQGPGYDAARRVYVHAHNYFDLTPQDEFICFNASIETDVGLDNNNFWVNQVGGKPDMPNTNTPTLNMSSNGVTYWFYVNSLRFIIVCKNGVDDYTMSYCGFLDAFALPDDFPFPLYIAGSGYDMEHSLSSSGTAVRDAQDPTSGAAWLRLWDGSWNAVRNHNEHVSRTEDWYSNPGHCVWPKHPGIVGRSNYPHSITGDHIDPEGHWLHNTDPTDQGDLPMIPSTVFSATYGMIGAIDGVFTIPGGGVLAAESTFTVGADTYRVFTCRNHSDGNQYYAIKEV